MLLFSVELWIFSLFAHIALQVPGRPHYTPVSPVPAVWWGQSVSQRCPGSSLSIRAVQGPPPASCRHIQAAWQAGAHTYPALLLLKCCASLNGLWSIGLFLHNQWLQYAVLKQSFLQLIICSKKLCQYLISSRSKISVMSSSSLMDLGSV